MTATTVNGANFSASNANEMPRWNPGGPTLELFSETLPTTSIDEANDRFNLTKVPHEAKIKLIGVTSNSDMDTDGSPALDMDFVIDEDGVETTLVNAGTFFVGANTQAQIWFVNHTVNAPVDGYGVVRLKVIAPAATAAQGTVAGFIIW